MNRKNVLWAIAGALVVCLGGCNFFGLFHAGVGPEKDQEHIERERQSADALVDTTQDIAQNGVEPQGRNAIVAEGLSVDLSRSLGTPQQKIDYQNDAAVRFLRAESARKSSEFEAKKKQFDETVAGLKNQAANLMLGGGAAGTIGLTILGFLWKNRKSIIQAKNDLMQEKEEVTQFAKGGVVGTSQLKATFDHGVLEIKQIAKTSGPEAALAAALKLLDRNTINSILRNGAEAVGGSTGLEGMLTSFKDDIEQNLLNRPLIDPKILIHG